MNEYHRTLERQHIDAEILALELQILDLRSKRNSIAPISLLPPELLLVICIHARNFSPHFSKSKTISSISDVCRGWRRLALDSPCLWSEIDLNHPTGIDTFVARSGQLPLTVKLQNDSAMDVYACKHHPRIENLDMDLTSMVDINTQNGYVEWRPSWSSSYLILRFLSLTRTALSPIMLSNTPSLQFLTLRSCFHHSIPSSSSLVSLLIVQPVDPVTVISLVLSLRSLPNLVHLSLDEVFMEAEQSTVPATPVHLPTLRKIQISAPAEQAPSISLLFRSVSLSRYAQTVVKIKSPNGNPDLSDIFMSCQRFRENNSPIHTLVVNKDLSTSEVSMLEGPKRFPGVQVCTQSNFSYNPFKDSAVLDLTLLQVLDLTLTGLYTSEYWSSVDLTHSAWSSYYGALRNLHTITVTDLAAYFFLKLLATEGRTRIFRPLPSRGPRPSALETSESRATRISPAPPAPLSFQALREVNLVIPCIYEDERVDERGLIFNLTIRKKTGIGLTRMTCVGWPFSTGFRRELEGMVGELLERE